MPKTPARTAGHPVAYCPVVRRRLLIAAIFLLAGAVVNVAVAWGCGSRPNCIDVGGYDFLDYLIDINQMDVEEVCEWWSRHAPLGFDSEPNIVVIATVEFGISTFTVGVAGNFDDALRYEILEPYLTQQVFRLRSGLPARSMEGAVWFRQPHPEIYDAAIQLPFDDVASPSPTASARLARLRRQHCFLRRDLGHAVLQLVRTTLVHPMPTRTLPRVRLSDG